MVILYSTGCNCCNVLKQKLQQKNINFVLVKDMTDAIDAGFMSAPVLKVNDEWMNFGTAIKWVNAIEN